MTQHEYLDMMHLIFDAYYWAGCFTFDDLIRACYNNRKEVSNT